MIQIKFYRIKQFYNSIYDNISKEDDCFVKEHLNSWEIELFYKLSSVEQKHSVKVAKDVKKVCKSKFISDTILVKGALLHDIGKLEKRLNIIDKSVLVILHNLSKGKMRKYSNLKKIDMYYNHGDKGYEILKALNYYYDERLLYLIKNHHNDNIIGDKELDILKDCDNKN